MVIRNAASNGSALCSSKGQCRIPKRISEQKHFLTAEEDLFVVDHLGIPELISGSNKLAITGLVEKELEVSSETFEALPAYEITAFHKCAGNPFFSSEPTPDRTGNVIWSGVRLVDILEKASPLDEAKYVWVVGRDFGSYHGDIPQNYCKDIPLDRVRQQDVLLATALNDVPLTLERGGPIRLIVPGFYATNSVKWVTSICLKDERSKSIFTTKFYNDEITLHDGTIERVPVWAVEPDSAIVSPSNGDRLLINEKTIVTGWAWGDVEISKVEVSADGGATWCQANLKRRVDRSWQSFSIEISELTSGKQKLISRATDKSGNFQPAHGARNAYVPIELVVEEGLSH